MLMWGSNLLAAKTGLDKPETGRTPTIGELIGLAIAAPEFQRR